jgi:hypothetical protein
MIGDISDGAVAAGVAHDPIRYQPSERLISTIRQADPSVNLSQYRRAQDHRYRVIDFPRRVRKKHVIHTRQSESPET